MTTMRAVGSRLVKVFVLALVLPATTFGVAAADHPPLSLPVTDLLPPLPVPAQPRPDERCPPPPTAACIDAVISKMVQAHRTLDEACHPRAVFALAYLRTTEGFRDALRRGLFDDEAWMIDVGRLFADFYFDAVEGHRTGRAPPAWQTAFDAADGRATTGAQDFLLGMNAHIQRDLPIVLYRMGLVGTAGSHKRDHDRVNRVLSDIFDAIQDELATRYDPAFALTDARPLPLDETAALETIRLWREGAWRNAERLAAASEQEREAVMKSIEAGAQAWASLIALPKFSFSAASRTDYCRSVRGRPR